MMEVDSRLKYSCKDFQKTLVGNIPNFSLDNEIMHSPVSEPYPSVSVLAQFALKVYDDMGKDTHDMYEEKLKLPVGWKLLTTAYNDDRKNGYFGAALWSPSLQQVVVSHRGTKLTDTGSWWTNVIGVYFKNDSYRMISAITFVETVKCAIHMANKSTYRFHLSITGHSLGGWLAQITGFTVKYLQTKHGKFIKNRNQQIALHAHIVAFDSPGCKNKLDDIIDNCDYRYSRTVCLEALDISNYLSAPNSINTLGLHVGSIYRVMIDVSKFSIAQRFTAQYTLATHKIENIVKALESNNTIYRMKDWPVSHLSNSPEYENFQLEASKANEYHLDIEEDESFMIRYKCETSDNSSSLRIFSDDELKLLHFSIIFKRETVQTIKIQTFLTKNKLGTDLFENVEISIKNHTITCGSKECLEMVIKRAKLLVRWFREELMEAVDQQSREIPAMMYFMANKNYLDQLPKCQMNFSDSIGLQIFLESSTGKILHIETEDIEFEMTRLYNIFCQLQKELTCHQSLKAYLQHDTQTFVHWTYMVTLGNVVDIDNLYKSDFTRDNLLILDCSSSTGTSPDLGGEKIFKQFINNVKKKLILVSSRQGDSESLLKSFHIPIKQVPFKQIELIDLTKEAQTELFVRKMLSIGGEMLSLEDFAGTENFTHFISHINTTIDVQKLKSIVIDKSYVMELKNPLLNHDNIGVHSALNRQVSKTRVTRVLREYSSSALLVISGVERQETTEAWEDLMDIAELNQGLEERITSPEKAELLFKQFCRDKPDKNIYWLDVSAGVIRCKQMYMRDFYMERKFYNRIIFDFNLTENFLKDELQDIFIFQNVTDRKSLMDILSRKTSKKVFLKSENIQTAVSAEQVDDIIKRYNDKPVHVLKFEDNDGTCVWLRSQGSIEGLRPYVTSDTCELIDERELCEISQKVVIIADEPGMGKSTSLTSMSRLFKSALVIRINLKDFLIPIQNLPPVLSVHSVTEFILAENKDSLLNGLLQFCLQHENSRQVYLLFDGFDEIKEDHSANNKNTKNEVLKLLQYLKNETTARIWVTTRLYQRIMLENGLAIFATTFQKISEEQQRKYILEFWRSHLVLELDNYGEAEESKLKNGARNLYQEVKEALGTDVNGFMGVLLQTRMLAEIFLQSVKDNVESEVETSLKVESILDLYQKLVIYKYDIYFSDKTRLNTEMSSFFKNSNIVQFTEKHRMLGVFTLFPEFAKEFFDDIEEELKQWGAELCRVGLVQLGGGGIENIEFTHHTLAEYFCADLAIQWLHKKGRYHRRAPMVELLLTKILLQDSYKVIRIFINNFVLIKPLSKDADKISALKISELWSVKQNYLFNRFKETALHIAVEEGNEGIIDIVIGGSKCEPVQTALIAFIAAHNQNGHTALGLAAQIADHSKIMERMVQSFMYCSYEVILELLLATYIRLPINYSEETRLLNNYLEREDTGSKIKTAFFRTQKIIRDDIPPFLAAVRESRAEDVDELYRKMENNTERHYVLLAPDEGGDTALHLAAQNKPSEELNKIQTQIIKILCDHNNPGIGRSYNSHGETPLHSAARAGHLDIVKHLINHGVYIDSLNLQGDIALSRAAEMGYLPVVKYLIRKGANINHLDKDGRTTLFKAASNGSLPLVKYLTENGANINILDLRGCTVLFYAATNGNLPLVEYLVEKEVDITPIDKDGCTALFIATFVGSLPMAEFLVEKGADINTSNKDRRTPLLCAVANGSLPLVEYLVEKGAAINIADIHGGNAVFIAASNGNLPLVKYLVKKGIDINTLNKNGHTALFGAVTNGNFPLVKYLIEKGADIHIIDKNGCSILFFAATNGSLPLVEYLVKKGANIDIINKTGSTALFCAITTGSIPLVKYLVEKGADINTLANDGCSVLFAAASKGNLPMVKFLKEKGVDINTLDEDGRSILFSAASNGSLPLVKYLIESGADINTLDIYGCNVLSYKTTNGTLPLVEYLVEKGADINIIEDDGRSILFNAVINGNLPLVKYFVEKGANINILNNIGRTVLFYAALNGSLPMVEYFLKKGADINTIDKDGRTALFCAVTNGSITLVEYLVEKGADINILDEDGCTILFYTATYGKFLLMEYFVKKGADINILDKNGCPVLFYAVTNGSLLLVKYLVKKGAKINIVGKDGRTVLFHAAANGRLPVVEYLFEKGADISTLDKNGRTALFGAASNGTLPVVEYLLKKGANIHTLDNDGRTALFDAASNGSLPVVEYLLEKGSDINTVDINGDTALFHAVSNESFPLVEYLVENGADIKTINKYGHTALFYAASKGSLLLVKYLVDNGADVNTIDKYGSTPLFDAASNGSLSVVEYLFKKGADIHTLDKDGRTALFDAVQNGSIPLVDYLLKKGLDINILDKDGRTVLFDAASNGSIPLVEYLVDKGADINIIDKEGRTALNQ